jgi:dimethylglycine dehydrogenase
VRWFRDHLPKSGVQLLENLSESWLGFSISGAASQSILARLSSESVSNEALPFLACREVDVGLSRAVVARLSLTGDIEPCRLCHVWGLWLSRPAKPGVSLPRH